MVDGGQRRRKFTDVNLVTGQAFLPQARRGLEFMRDVLNNCDFWLLIRISNC